MVKNNLLKYLLISPNLPVGGFCYSEGLECLINKKIINSHNDIKFFILDEIKYGQIRIDANSLKTFINNYIKIINDDNKEKRKHKIYSLNKWLIASRDSKEIRAQQSLLNTQKK